MTPADNTPRSAHQLVAGALGVYRRYPLLFLVLAAGVIVPYEVIVLAATGSGSFSQSTGLLLLLIELFLISPLVSAMHVHAVADLREGRDPRLVPVARRGLGVLPVVAAVSIISWLGIGLGLLLLIIPGIILMLRWFVVAQTAAIEHEGWLPALRRGAELTDGHYGHVFVFSIYVGLIAFVPMLLVEAGFGDSKTAASFLVGTIVQIVAISFTALATALLFYDLRTRREASAAPELPVGPMPDEDRPSIDPRRYSDEDRPKGWYVDPSSPDRMRYWGAADPPDWSGDTRTPRKVRRAWAEESE